MSTAKKAAATKPTVKKSAAAKAAPSHPTWVDMIKVIIVCNPPLAYRLLFYPFSWHRLTLLSVAIVLRPEWAGQRANVSVRADSRPLFFIIVLAMWFTGGSPF